MDVQRDCPCAGRLPSALALVVSTQTEHALRGCGSPAPGGGGVANSASIRATVAGPIAAARLHDLRIMEGAVMRRHVRDDR
jgi:hypothetical protein